MLRAPLGLRDLSTIGNNLAPIACNWELFGTCLPGLDYSEVKEIKEQRLTPKEALVAVIERWLNTAQRKVTWQDILDTLRMPLLKEKRLSEDIEKKVCSQSLCKL